MSDSTAETRLRPRRIIVHVVPVIGECGEQIGIPLGNDQPVTHTDDLADPGFVFFEQSNFGCVSNDDSPRVDT